MGSKGETGKRALDITVSAVGLLVLAPVLVLFMAAIWWEDFRSPFYVARRVGRNGRVFHMVKLRSMTTGADRTGVDSTAADDPRVTSVGRILRAYKLDELSQLWNVLKGDMSLVGPRPQVERDVAILTEVERRILSVKPGITDLASIVFADEGEILKGRDEPDIAYNQLIRPGKSLLALFYIDRRSLMVDVQVCWLTALAIVSRSRALYGVQRLLKRLAAPPPLIDIASRSAPLLPTPPPGAALVVTSRKSRTENVTLVS